MDPLLVNQPGVFLVLHGVDTVAQIRLNGFFLGETDNMFVRYRFNVRNLLKVSPRERERERVRKRNEVLGTLHYYAHSQKEK